jgi:peptide/nickel transport system substrate-binding protein
MNVRSKGLVLFSTLMIFSMVLAACAPAATPQTIIQTVEVMVQGTPVVQTQVVEVTSAAPPEQPTAEEGPIMATEGLVACKPLPELPSAASYSAPVSVSAPVPASGPTIRMPAAMKPVANSQQTGKVYRVGVFEDVTTTNYFAANGPDNTVWNSYMLPARWSLYTLSEKYFTFVPSLAKALPDPLTQEGDNWVVSIPIRDDVKWSDGTPMTANDVAWTANFVLKVGLISGNWVSYFDPEFLQSIEAVDDYTVKIIYHTKPGLARHEYGTLGAPILNAAYWQAKVDEAGVLDGITALGDNPDKDALSAAQAEAADKLFAIVPDGEPLAGAYILNKWEKGAFLENAKYNDWADSGLKIEQWADGGYRDSHGFELNPGTGDPDLTEVQSQNADSVVFTIYGSQDAAILAMQNDEVDFVINPLGLQRGLANKVKTDPNLTVIENNVNGFRYLSFNTRRRPMNDCAFRQAVAVLIDKEFVTGTILQGVAFPNYTFVPPGNAAWYNDDVPKLGMSLDREQRTNLALAILKQAGYTWEGGVEPAWDPDNLQVTQAGRMLMPDGTPVPALTMPAPSPGYDPLRSTFAIWIETWLNEFGIPLKANLAGFNVIVPIIFTEQNFDMYILGWSLSIFPSYLNDFFAESQAAQDGNNAGGYVNPEVEAQLKEILTCETFDECKSIANNLQVILATELPYVLLFDTGIIEAYRSASVVFPYDSQLSGLQYTHQLGAIYPSVSFK